MNKTIQLFNRLIIHEISYELGDQTVIAKCELQSTGKSFETTMIISHTDLNRIISKIAALGYEFKTENINKMCFSDGTEILEYKFENVFGQQIPLENFDFVNEVKEIRA